MSTGYVHVLRQPGAAAFVTAGFVGRLPISMVSLGVVLLVTAQGGNYALAGALSATYALAAAAIGPLGARWVDRAGQARAVPVLLGTQVTGLLLFTWAAASDAAVVVQFVLLVVAGGAAPNVGSLVRARWAALLAGAPGLRSAFALEAIVDEFVFVVGPPLVTTVALAVDEVTALMLCAVLFVLGTGWLVTQRRTQPAVRRAGGSARHGRILTGAIVVLIAEMVLMGAIFGSFEVTTVAFTQFLGHEELTGVVLALYAFGSLLAGLAVGAARISADLARQMFWFTGLLAVVTFPIPFVGHIGLLVAAAFLSGMAVSPVLVTAAMIVEHVVPAARLTEALTLTTSGIAVGLALGSTSAGALVDQVGANAGYWIMSVSAVVALVLAAGTARRLSRTSLAET